MSESEPLQPVVGVEVPGTPEQVWELIATGPGISTWFMPAEVDERVGGSVTQRHGPGDDDVSRGTISAYDPPHRFAYEETWEGRTVATEFLVEAHSGGTCVVRVVTHGLTSDDAGFVDDLTQGWTQALTTLRVRLAAFADRPAGSARLWTHPPGTLDAAWNATLRRLGLDGVATGERIDRASGAHPPISGAVELVQRRGIVLRIDGPHPGVLGLAATGFGDRTSIVVDRYVYADDARARAEAEREAWAAYLA
jgi:uncharacterized protein YndB with AHSA1/START domain